MRWTKEELDRYHRQMILPQVGPEGQERLKRASVVVVGAGGLGVPVLQYLVAAGVGRVGFDARVGVGRRRRGEEAGVGFVVRGCRMGRERPELVARL